MEKLILLIVCVAFIAIIYWTLKGNPKSDGIHQFSYYSGDKFTIHTNYDEERIKGFIFGGEIRCMIETKCDESELSKVRIKERERIKEIVRKMELAEKIK
jgi:hypothetical protein